MLIHRPSWRHTRVPITLNSLGLYVNLCVKHVLNLGTDVNMQRILSCRKTTAVTQGGTAKSNLTEIAFHFPRFYGLSSPRTQIQLVMCGFPASSASLREVRSKLMRKKKASSQRVPLNRILIRYQSYLKISLNLDLSLIIYPNAYECILRILQYFSGIPWSNASPATYRSPGQ